MKKIILTISSILGLLAFSGCADFLERPKYGRPEGWQTEADVWGAIASLYSNVSNDSEGVTGRGIMWFECCSDNITVGRTQDEANQIRNFNMAPSNGRDAKDTWPAMYQINAKANNIINVVPTMSDISQELKDLAVGTAYFWRGLAMLWIAPYYGDNGPNGGIPIILHTTEPDDMDSPRPKSVIDNYDQIISDMKTAADYLPYFSELPAEQYGLPHKAACWAFAARAALYASQWDKNYYKTVSEMCDKVMNLSGADKRDLYDDNDPDNSAFANLWTKENNFSSEYLFSLLGNEIAGPKFHGMSFQMDGWSLYNTWGYYQPTYNLYQAFEDGDERRDATILFPGQHITFANRDVWFGAEGWSISSDTGMTFRKFMSIFAGTPGEDYNSNGNDQSNKLGMCLMRFADVLLMKAEAMIALNGEGDNTAVECLNRIRKRAGLPENSNATWAQLKNERRCELAFEFMPSRHIDLIRWGDAQEVYAQPTYKVTSSWNAATNSVDVTEDVIYDNGRTFDPVKNQVFPIPEAAFDGSVNLKQNQGY